MDKELINSHTKIKICGMTCEADIKAVNTYLPDYIGFVLFFDRLQILLSDLFFTALYFILLLFVI